MPSSCDADDAGDRDAIGQCERSFRPANHRIRLIGPALLVALALLGYALAAPTVDLRVLADDYVEYWAAGRLNLSGGNPYAADQLLPLERAAGRTAETLMMWNPPYTLALVMPLALADYPLSRLLWLLLNAGAIMAATAWWWQLIGGPPPRWQLAQAVAFTFFAAVTVLRMGQIGPLLLLGIVGFLRYTRLRRDGLAGAYLALIAIKPHLLYLVWPALALWAMQTRRWRAPAGAALTLLAATTIALAANPRVIGQYLAATAADSPLVWATPTFGSLLRTLFGFDRRWLQFVPLAPGLIWLLLYWRRCRNAWEWPAAMPLLLLVSTTTTAFGWSFDLVVLTPAILVVARRLLATGLSPRALLLVLAYVGFNAAAWSLYGRVTDFWQLWLSPALLIWYLGAAGLAAMSPQAEGGRR